MDGVLENIISNANSIQESDDTEVIFAYPRTRGYNLGKQD